MLQVSGLTYTWDARRPQNHRVVEVRRDGVPLDKTATYTVTVNNFLAQGGDKFTIFSQGAHLTPGPKDLDALVTYLQSLPQPFTATIRGRIKRLP
jgi:5'-nucleotidase